MLQKRLHKAFMKCWFLLCEVRDNSNAVFFTTGDVSYEFPGDYVVFCDEPSISVLLLRTTCVFLLPGYLRQHGAVAACHRFLCRWYEIHTKF